MNGCRARPPLRSHHQHCLAREGGESRLTARAFGDVARKCRFADSRIAEDAKHLGLALFEPPADLVDRVRLLARPFAADWPRRWGLSRAGGLRPGCRLLGRRALFDVSTHLPWLGARAATRTDRRLAV